MDIDYAVFWIGMALVVGSILSAVVYSWELSFFLLSVAGVLMLALAAGQLHRIGTMLFQLNAKKDQR